MQVDIKQHKEYMVELLHVCSDFIEQATEYQSSEFFHRGMVLALKDLSKATDVTNAIGFIYQSGTEEKIVKALGSPLYEELTDKQKDELKEGYSSVCDYYMQFNVDDRKFKY